MGILRIKTENLKKSKINVNLVAKTQKFKNQPLLFQKTAATEE